MILSTDQLRVLSQGAECIEERDGAVYFSRFNAAEMSVYLARPDFLSRAESTAGIMLEFTTNAETLFLSVTKPGPGSYYNYYAFDILVNGILLGQLTNLRENPENGHYWDFINPEAPCEKQFPLGTGEKQVRIVFPWSMNLGIQHLELMGGTYAQPVEKARKLLIYGDSITQGAACIYPSRTYASLLGNWLEANTCNKGVGSEMYCPDLVRTKTDWVPDIITVAYGINDWCTVSKETYRDNCRNFWERLCANYPNAKKFAMSPIWYLNHAAVKPFGPFEELLQVIRDCTKDLPNVISLDCTDFVSTDTADFGDLYVHPNHLGFEKFFQNLSREIAKHL